MGLLLFFLSMFFLVLVLMLFSSLSSLRRSIDALKHDVADLRKRVDGADRGVASPSASGAPAPVPQSATPLLVLSAATPGEPKPSLQIPAPAPSRTREEWEALIGGKLLNRIGALALIIGVGFFLKYAFDNNWISETVRVLIGASFGVSLLYIAAKAHAKNFEVFAQGLVGAGIAILYIAVFASFNFYHLVPQAVAFALMGGVTIIAFTQAFRYDSLAVSLLGLAGGFLTPFLLSTGQANTVGLFSYIALLAAGMLTIVYGRPKWYVLQPLTAIGTAGVYLTWYLYQYNTEELSLAIGFASLLWLLFLLFDLALELRGERPVSAWPHVVSGAIAIAFHWMLMELLAPSHEDWRGLVTLLIALVYLFVAMFVRRRRRESRFGWATSGMISAYLLAVGIGIQFDGNWIIIGWAIATVAILQIAVRSETPLLPAIVLLLPAMNSVYLVGQSLLGEPAQWATYRPMVNERALAYLTTIASVAAASRILGTGTKQWSIRFSRILEYAWPVLLFVLLTVETNDVFRHREWAGGDANLIDFQRWLALSLVWTAYGAGLAWAGRFLNVPSMPELGTGGIFLGVLLAFARGLAGAPLLTYSPMLNERVLVILLVAGLGYLSLPALASLQRAQAAPWIRKTVRVGVTMLFLSLATGEVRDAFEQRIVPLQTSADDYARTLLHLRNLQQLSLSGVWLLFSIIVMVIGIVQRYRPYRLLAIVIFGITILKIFFYDLSFLETLYRIFSFIALGLILLATSYLYQRNKDIILGRPQ